MKIFSIIIISFIASRGICIAQAKEAKPSKIFLSTGFGAAGSFYVRDYDEALPFPSSYYKAFFKKNFVGIAQEIAIGLHLKKNIDLKIGFNHQRFTRKVYVNDTLSRGVGLFLDNRIQHADNIKRSRRKAPKRSPDKNDLPGLFVLLHVDRSRRNLRVQSSTLN